MSNTQHPIRVNHRGFLTSGSKRFVLVDNKSGEEDFSIIHILCDEKPVVYHGRMTRRTDEEGKDIWIGDFSDFTENGDYRLVAGGYTSRAFVIYDKAYDICARMMVEYFTYQRCGSDLGWNGCCHLDDGYIFETGEHVDLTGGYHQSCDLRKSPAGTAIGVLGMMRYAVKDTSEWGKRLLSDETAWACDYFVKTIQANGAMYNTLNEPFGWDGRVLFRSPAPSSAQWCATTILAMGYRFFEISQPERANRYLRTALRSYSYMTGNNRSVDVYRHPAHCPRGMDQDYFYAQCYKNSGADYAYQAMAAAELYRATADEEYLTNLKLAAEQFSECMLDGDLAFCAVWDQDHPRFVGASGTYAWLPAGIMSLCDAMELLDSHSNLEKLIRKAADGLCRLAEQSPWRRIPTVLADADLDGLTGHPKPGENALTIRSQISALRKIGCGTVHGKTLAGYVNADGKKFVASSACFYGAFLARAGKMLGEKRYLTYAQSVLDQLLGGDRLDSSKVQGIGYNHIPFGVFGQFFPSTPFIPGAVGTPYDSIDAVKSGSSEYDMPCVGMALTLLAELCYE